MGAWRGGEDGERIVDEMVVESMTKYGKVIVEMVDELIRRGVKKRRIGWMWAYGEEKESGCMGVPRWSDGESVGWKW